MEPVVLLWYTAYNCGKRGAQDIGCAEPTLSLRSRTFNQLGHGIEDSSYVCAITIHSQNWLHFSLIFQPPFQNVQASFLALHLLPYLLGFQ
jgi:hypothetical protein